jgi:hypothetical protein
MVSEMLQGINGYALPIYLLLPHKIAQESTKRALQKMRKK